MSSPEVPLGEALRELPQDISALIRAELERFKGELRENARNAAIVGAWAGAGALIGLGAFGAFTAFFILVLDLIFRAWLSALIVTVFWGIVAAGLLTAARSQMQHLKVGDFSKTTRSVKEDIEWIKSGSKARE